MTEIEQTIITDVDGVLNNGLINYNANGKLFKSFSGVDNDGAKLLRMIGYELRAISADKKGFNITKKRLLDMNITVDLVDESNRLTWLEKNFDLKSSIYIGDGVWDSFPLRKARIGFAPSSATSSAKKCADIILKSGGGQGVLLEVAEILIKKDLGLSILSFLEKENEKNS